MFDMIDWETWWMLFVSSNLLALNGFEFVTSYTFLRPRDSGFHVVATCLFAFSPETTKTTVTRCAPCVVDLVPTATFAFCSTLYPLPFSRALKIQWWMFLYLQGFFYTVKQCFKIGKRITLQFSLIILTLTLDNVLCNMH